MIETGGLESVPCALCGRDETVPMLYVRDMHFTVDAKRDRVFPIVRCLRCSLCFVNPRPTREELPSYHPGEFYYAYRPLVTPRGRAKVRAAFKRWTASAHFGYPMSSGPVARAFQWLVTYPVQQRLARIVIPHDPPGRLLDVGCGSGEFLHWMHGHSRWEVHGVEPSPVGSAYARDVLGLDVVTGTLIDARWPSDHFDVVTFWDSFIHVPDPMETLSELRRILKPNGVATFIAPNIESYEAKVFGPNWFMLDVPRHLYHYSPRTITAMLERGGFRVRRLDFPGGYSGLGNSLGVWRQEVAHQRAQDWEGPPAVLRLMCWIADRLATSPDWRMRVEAVKA